MLLRFLRLYINGSLLNNLHACIGLMSGKKICILIIMKRGWQYKAGIYTLLLGRPPPFRILFFYVYMHATDSTKRLFNLYIYRTLSEKNVCVNHSYNVDMNEYANTTISKQQIPLECSVPHWCNGTALACRPSGWWFESLTQRGNFEVSKVLYDIRKHLALF